MRDEREEGGEQGAWGARWLHLATEIERDLKGAGEWWEYKT
jgi:hypothetical protein